MIRPARYLVLNALAGVSIFASITPAEVPQTTATTLSAHDLSSFNPCRDIGQLVLGDPEIFPIPEDLLDKVSNEQIRSLYLRVHQRLGQLPAREAPTDAIGIYVQSQSLQDRIIEGYRSMGIRAPRDMLNISLGDNPFQGRHYQGEVYICAPPRSADYLAYLISHEMAHAAGVHDEVSAESLSLRVLASLSADPTFERAFLSHAEQNLYNLIGMIAYTSQTPALIEDLPVAYAGPYNVVASILNADYDLSPSLNIITAYLYPGWQEEFSPDPLIGYLSTMRGWTMGPLLSEVCLPSPSPLR